MTAAIRACFAEWRMVKTRKVLTLCFEVPLEQQAEVLTILGAPMPDAEIWCGIARLNEGPATKSDRADAAKLRYAAQSPQEQAVTRAAMLPKNPMFREWLTEYTGWLSGEMTEEEAAWSIRHECGVDSRRELSTDAGAYKAFLALESAWLVASGQMAEPR